MQVNVNLRHVKTNEDRVQQEVEHALERFAERMTRVEVFLSDVNGHKGGPDKQCKLEARPRGLDPVAVEALAEQPMEAVTGALGKLERMLDSRFGRLDRHH